MIRVALLLALVALAAPAAGPAAAATRECTGLQVCVPVAGPWVVVPTAEAGARPQASFVLACPPGFVVGGLDAELSVRDIDLTFDGRIGAPVNPGVTTERDAVFRATRTAGPAGQRASFRPHVGCMPAAGGGGPRPRTGVRLGIPVAAPAVYPPGRPVVRHVRNVPLRAGKVQRVAVACARGERLVSGSRAVGFGTAAPPSARLADAVTTTLATTGGRVVATVRNTLPRGAPALVQVVAACAGGGA